MTPLQPVRVVAGILHRDGEILVAQRPSEKHGEGLWEFPGGKIEPDETAEQALRRELKEELGIDVLAMQTFESVEHVYTDRVVQIQFFRIAEWCGDARGNEGQETRWCTLAQLSEVNFLPANSPVVARLQLAG